MNCFTLLILTQIQYAHETEVKSVSCTLQPRCGGNLQKGGGLDQIKIRMMM